MNYSIMTERETEIELATSADEGLSSFVAHDRLIDNGRNKPEKSYSKSPVSVILSQFKNLYTLAFFVMGIIAAVCDFKGNSAAVIIFFAVAAVNVVSGFLRDNTNRQIARDFDRMRSDEVKIVRDGKMVMTDPTLLVKGDIVVLEEGDFVPADLRILRCSELKADETIFKRLIPQDKQSERLEDQDPYEAANMLYCGSVIAHGSAIGAVVGTGKDTVLAKTNERRSKKLDMHNNFAKSTTSEKLLLCAALMAAGVILCFVALSEKSFSVAMVHSCSVALCLLPAPVCMVRFFAMKVSEREIKKNNVELSDKNFVYNIGMTEYVLFDKGGVITSGAIEMEERVVSGHDKLALAAICSDCNFENSTLTGSDIDKATIRALMDEGMDVEKILSENERILFMPFDEKRKLMAVVIKTESGYRLIVKGSVEVVPTLCSHIADGEDIYSMSGEMMHRIENISSAMAERGLKVRAFAYRDIESVPENIEDEIKSLVFTGALGYREVIVKKARESVKTLEDVFVKPIMVTGDQTVTAAALAKQAGLIKKESECISFREIADVTDEELAKCANEYKVFTSATRSDRERLVRVLAGTGAVTAVAGEQMTEHSVAINASVTIGNYDDCDTKTPGNDINRVSDVIYRARAARSNMAYVSLLAITAGVAEALVLIYMIMTRQDYIPSPLNMLLLNLFVMCVPCGAITLFASTHQKINDMVTLALKSLLQGVVAALLCMISGNIITFFVLYTVMEAARICVWFNNLSVGKKGVWGLIAMGVVLVGSVLLATANMAGLSEMALGKAAIGAAIAVVINGVIPTLKLKGWKKTDV